MENRVNRAGFIAKQIVVETESKTMVKIKVRK